MKEIKRFSKAEKPVAENLKKQNTLEKALIEELSNVEHELRRAFSATSFTNFKICRMIDKGTTWEKIAEVLEKYTEDLIKICNAIKDKCE